MFELIKKEIPFNSWQEVAFPKKIEERRLNRLEAIEELILSIGIKSLGYQFPEICAVMLEDPYDMVPAANKNKIFIPAVCLLNQEDLPAHLRINDPLDPRINDPEWFNQFGFWLNEHLGTIIKKPNFLERENFRLYIKFLQDPNKASKAIEFILGHELGHIVYRHCDNPSLITKTNLISGAIFGMIMAKVFGPEGGSNYYAIGKLCFGALVGMVGATGLHALRLLQKSRMQERQADQFSYKINHKAREGAIYLFDLIRNHYKTVKESLSTSLSMHEYLIGHLLINSNGELRILNWTHGSFFERMERAKNYVHSSFSKTILTPFFINNASFGSKTRVNN